MVNFGYHLARAHGSAMRHAYAAFLPALVRQKVRAQAELPFEVYSYSGEAALPEQVASIRSFLRHAGRPKKFTIVSDGTYSPRSLELLQTLDPVVHVSASAARLPPNTPRELDSYLTTHPTGKQLALIMSLPVDAPALYVDSDVLFFHAADRVSALAESADAPALYLADCHVSADERLFREPQERANPVNTGVLLLRRKLDWSLSIRRFLELERQPSFFTNQTMTHLTMHANGAQPMDPRKFVLQLDDQFRYADRYAGPDIALRHYVNPVRHKFWTSLRRT